MAAPRHSGPADPKEYEDYLREINDIEQGKEPPDPEDPGTDDELSKTPDGELCIRCGRFIVICHINMMLRQILKYFIHVTYPNSDTFMITLIYHNNRLLL